MVTAHFKNSSNGVTKAEIAFHNLSVDLEYLNTAHTTDETPPAHIYQEISANPLLRAVASVKPPACLKSPINFTQIATHDAVRKDLQVMLHVLHQELGGTPELQTQINNLRTTSSDELLQATRTIVTGLQRNVIASAHKSISGMHHQAQSGLWSRGKTSEQRLVAHLHQAEQHLTEALALFDAGDMRSAFKLYNQVMRTNAQPIQEFASATDTDFYLQFGTGLGVMAAAGAAFAYTGGAALYAFTGSATVTSSTGIGAYAASLVVGGASCTLVEKVLSHHIFDVPYFKTNDAAENVLEFTQSTLKTAAMVGYLRGFSQVMPLPAYTGSGAKFVNFGAGVTHEVAGLTSFTTLTDGPTQAMSPDALAHTLATVVGLRGGHAALRRTPAIARSSFNSLSNFLPNEMGEMAPFPLFLVSRVAPVMSALYLMTGKIPPAILTTQLLGLRPTSPRNIALIQLLGRMGASRPMALLRAAVNIVGGIRVFEKDTINRIENATDFANLIMANLGRAIAGKQPVGFELEFDPKAMSRDQTHIMMAKALEDAGYKVDIQYGAQDFAFKTQLKVAPIIIGEGSIKGQPVRTEIFQHNGTTLVSVVRNTDSAKTHVITKNQTTSLAEADAHLRSVLDAEPREKYLIIAKDDSGDTLKLDIAITGQTTARLTGINGRFYDAEQKLQDSIEIDFGAQLRATTDTNRPQLAALLAYIKHSLPETLAIQKTNRITHLQVDGLGNGIFQVVDEVPPFLEAITAKMSVGEAGHTKPMIAAFSNGGFDGTRAAKMVGMHVHAEVAYQVNSQVSIAPALTLLRAFAAGHQYIYDLFPSHHNRSGFIQRMPKAYQKLLEDPNYVTDPTDPAQIARVIADYNAHTPVKYSDLNMDNLFSVIVNRLGLDPALARTAPVKPTAELRLFDSIMDPDSVTFIAQFWGSFVYKYANSSNTMPQH